jgi:hypothetical protein
MNLMLPFRVIAFTYLVCLAGACDSQTSSSAPKEKLVELMSYGSEGGSQTIWEVSRARLDRQAKWAPETGPPPLSIAKACEVGATWLKGKFPEIKEFQAEEVILQSSSHVDGRREGVWYYHVDFNPVVGGHSLRGEGGIYTVVVLFDGMIVESRTVESRTGK